MIPHTQTEAGRVDIPAVWQFRLSELMLLVTFLGLVMPGTWRMAGYFTSYRQDVGVFVASFAIFLILYGPIIFSMLGALLPRSAAPRMLFWGFLFAGWGLSYLLMIAANCLQ